MAEARPVEPIEAEPASGTADESPALRRRPAATPAYERYHIAVRPAPEIASHPSRFRVRVKKHRLLAMVLREALDPRTPMKVALSRPCVYGVYGRPVGGLAPIHSKCVGCLRCSTQYPEFITIVPNPRRAELGDRYLRPDWVDTINYEAGVGHVPVRGAGYRGEFGGDGWDGMWTDMSEIVRPTRDGIHGREFISTAVDIGAKPSFLRLDGRGDAVGALPHVISLPVPFVFDAPPRAAESRPLLAVLAGAAERVGTLAVVPLPAAVRHGLAGAHVAPLVAPAEVAAITALPEAPRVVFLDGWDGAAFAELTRRLPDAVVGVRVGFEADVETLVRAGVRVLHLTAGYHGTTGAGFVADRIQEVHRALVDAGVREEVTLIGSGGVVLAEHVPKAIICGLDAVALDTAPLAALQARFEGDALDRETARVRLPRLPLAWGVQRLTNLAGSWRDQLLEVMGAMGLREVRRLRGELGRCMFQRDLEREAFGELPLAVVRGSSFETTRDEARGAPAVVATREHHPWAADATVEQKVVAKHRSAMRRGFAVLPTLAFGTPPALGDARWPADLILATWRQAGAGAPPENGLEHRVGRSNGGFDRLSFAERPPRMRLPERAPVDTSIALNRRPYDRRVEIPVPWYGGGMSFGSVSEQVMLSRAMNARNWRTFTSTGEGGYPASLLPLAGHVITQVATGMFGVREETIQAAPIVEFKYAQGAKPGLGGHLLGDKATTVVAQMRESVPWVSLFSPFPFHSVYSVEDHKKHIDWIKTVNPGALVSVKVSTPTDVDMVAVGSYYAGAHIIQIDGSYGGTGAAPEIAKKNIAMPIELAIPRVHRFLVQEGIRDEVTLMASGGIRTAHDIAKAIALGADGVILGTAELVALGCTRCSNCERGRGCPYGLTTTDPELSQFVDPEWGAERLGNLYRSFQLQLEEILRRLGLASVRELRGRTDLLVYRGREDGR
ncbi:MAG TPA: glutamate synthase-related protein [Thermoanaerobaculaceae bacterium]|nr:glutamate synthase-related protein [Thermoanaerobaculaceae bacterium]